MYDDHLEGYVWAENIGWIRLGAYSAGGSHTYANTNNSDYGVNNTTAGVLSGYGWSTNAGRINFRPTHGGVIALSDALLALEILSGSDLEACPDADVNTDGQIGIQEAVFILNALSK